MPKRPSVKTLKNLDKKIPSNTISNKLGVEIVIACFLILVFIAYFLTSIGIYSQIIIALAVVIISGEFLARLKNSSRLTFGTYMFRTDLGLKLIERVSKSKTWFWNAMADWGLVLGFGLLSYFIFKKQISKKMYAFGIFSLIMISIFILPYLPVALRFINIPQLNGALAQYVPTPAFTNYPLMIVDAVGGFILYLAYGFALATFITIQSIAITLPTLFTPTPNLVPINSIIPGVVPLIPGVTLPFFAGILALVVVLTVHEFSHGILIRIAKTKLKSSGLLAVGIVPIGAFVEPEEKDVEKLSEKEQNRISAAGVASNLLLSVLLFIPLLIFIYYILPIYQHSAVYVTGISANSPAAGVIPPNSMIVSWNHQNISTIQSLEAAALSDTPNSTVSVVTNNGAYLIRANSTGKIGVFLEEVPYTTGGLAGQMAEFVYSFIALTFLLNFFVAIVNYLPIPGLDGWRIFSTSIKRRKITFALSAYFAVALIISLLPYTWTVPIIGIPGMLIVLVIVANFLKWEWNWALGKTK